MHMNSSAPMLGIAHSWSNEAHPRMQIEMAFAAKLSKLVISIRILYSNKIRQIEVRGGMYPIINGTDTHRLSNGRFCTYYDGPHFLCDKNEHGARYNLTCETPIIPKFVWIQLGSQGHSIDTM